MRERPEAHREEKEEGGGQRDGNPLYALSIQVFLHLPCDWHVCTEPHHSSQKSICYKRPSQL
jgi:hypothetical protein